jgi:hypothetical protein
LLKGGENRSAYENLLSRAAFSRANIFAQGCFTRQRARPYDEDA